MQIEANIIRFNLWELFMDEESNLHLAFDEYDVVNALNETANKIHVPGLDGFQVVASRDNGTCRLSVRWDDGGAESARWLSSSKRLTLEQTRAEAPPLIRKMLDILTTKQLKVVSAWGE